jgi:hypothetical protein
MKIGHLLFMFIFTGLLSSCIAPYTLEYYEPNSVNQPLLSQKDDASISAVIGGSSYLNDGLVTYTNSIAKTTKVFLDLNLAYSPLNKFGVLAGFSGGKTNVDYKILYHDIFSSLYLNYQTSVFATTYSGYLGGGFYQTEGNFLFDIYAIADAGLYKAEQQATNAPDSFHSITKQFTFSTIKGRLSLQPSISYKGEVFNFGFTPRLAIINFFSPRGGLDTSEAYFMTDSYKQPYQVLFEPVVSLGFGYKILFLQIQLGTSKNLTSGFNNLIANVGVNLRLNENNLKHILGP